MAKTLKARQPSLDLPIRFLGKTCGAARLDLSKLRRLVARNLKAAERAGAELRAAATFAAGCEPGQDDVAAPESVHKCFEHVVGRFRETCADLVADAVLDWFQSSWPDDIMLAFLEHGNVDLGSPTFAVVRKRIVETGTKAERAELAAALRRGFAGIRKGRRPNLRPADVNSLRPVLPAIEKLVSATRRGNPPDHTGLTQFLRQVAPRIDYMDLRQRVGRATRQHLAVELVVAAVLDVTRDEARQAIRQVRRSNATKNVPSNP